MTDPHYPRNPPVVLQDFDRRQSNYVQMYRPDEHTSFSSVPMGDIITEQPMQSYRSQGPSGSHSQFDEGQMQMTSLQTGIPLPGFGILERVPTFKIQPAGLLQGHTTCSPGYKIHSFQGNLMLTGTTDTLFCPFDSKQKSVNIRDSNEDCIFQVKFTPSICACDSEEKRCFALFSPVFDNPFGAILFEAGQLKHSMKILNALEGETFVVEFLGTHDISIKGAEGSIVAVINIHSKRGEGLMYTLTFMEEVSSANKALFIGCCITLNLVNCESTVSRCICLAPILLSCLAIIGLSMGSVTKKGRKPG